MSGIEEPIASIQAKLDGLSGLPPDCTVEFDQIREEYEKAKRKPAAKAEAKPATKGK